MAKRNKRASQGVSELEREQVRARRIVGHDFALRQDGGGRGRLARYEYKELVKVDDDNWRYETRSATTAESKRQYEIASGGKAVRVRNVDPLKGISSLTEQQRAAGDKYRETAEAVMGFGSGSVPIQERVDGGKMGGGIPEAVSIAHDALAQARRAIGHHEIVGIIDDMCVAGLSASKIAEKTGDVRPAITRLLQIGLDNLSVHYGIVSPPKRLDAVNR